MARPFQDSLLGGLRPFEFINSSGETIPPGGCIRISSASPNVSNGAARPALVAGKPDTVGSQGQHFFNGLERVPDGKGGIAYKESLCFAAFESGDGTPALSEAWGPVSTGWKLRKRVGGFRIRAVSTNGQAMGLAVIEFAPWIYTYGKLDGDLAHGGSATVSVWDTTGDTTFNIIVYDEDFIGSGKEIVSGARIHAQWNELDQHWILTGSDTCPTTA
jgi:hypothetical protein